MPASRARPKKVSQANSVRRLTGPRRAALTVARGIAEPASMAICPGSYDPVTYGHIDIIQRSLRVFPRLTVAVAYNPNKDAAMFTPQERVDMIREAFADVGDRIVADSFTGLLVDYAERVGARIIVRGLRAVSDFEYEFQMTMMNRHLKPHIETVFMMADESYFYTSSRLVKEVASFGGDVRNLVPEFVLERFGTRFAKAPRR